MMVELMVLKKEYLYSETILQRAIHLNSLVQEWRKKVLQDFETELQSGNNKIAPMSNLEFNKKMFKK